MNKDQNLKTLFLFVLSYVLMYVIWTVVPELPSWGPLNPLQTDYMFYLLPVVGFFTIYLLVDWINHYFKDQSGYSIAVPLLLIVLSIVAYYVVLYWYWRTFFALQGMADQTTFDFVKSLLESQYLAFVVGGLFGWASKVAIVKLAK